MVPTSGRLAIHETPLVSGMVVPSSKLPITLNACVTATPFRLSTLAVAGETLIDCSFGALPTRLPPSWPGRPSWPSSLKYFTVPPIDTNSPNGSDSASPPSCPCAEAPPPRSAVW